MKFTVLGFREPSDSWVQSHSSDVGLYPQLPTLFMNHQVLSHVQRPVLHAMTPWRQALSRLSGHAEPMVGWPRALFHGKTMGQNGQTTVVFFGNRSMFLFLFLFLFLFFLLLLLLIQLFPYGQVRQQHMRRWSGKGCSKQEDMLGNMGIFICQQRTKQHVHTRNLHMYMHASIHPSIRRCTHAYIHIRPYVRPSIHPSVHTDIQTYRHTGIQTWRHAEKQR